MTKQEHWFSLVAEQQQSSYSITSFCAVKAIKLPTFHYWRKKYKQADTSQGRFMDITAAALQDNTLRITYPNGVNIHLSSVDLPLVAQLIRLA